MNKKSVKELIREFVLLELEQNPSRKANDINQFSDDSIDLQLDRSISSFDKSAKSDQGLELKKFVADIALMAEHIPDQIDLKGVLVRRVANYLTKAYDDKVSKEVLKMLEDNYGLSTDTSFRRDTVDDSEVPISKTGGPDASGGA